MQGPGSLKEPDMRRGVSMARGQEFPPWLSHCLVAVLCLFASL